MGIELGNDGFIVERVGIYEGNLIGVWVEIIGVFVGRAEGFWIGFIEGNKLLVIGEIVGIKDGDVGISVGIIVDDSKVGVNVGNWVKTWSGEIDSKGDGNWVKVGVELVAGKGDWDWDPIGINVGDWLGGFVGLDESDGI